MTTLTDKRAAVDLGIWSFCEYFVRSHGAEQVFDAELMASSFRSYFSLPVKVSATEWKEFAINVLGIEAIQYYSPKSGERATWVRLAKSIHILIKEDDWHGSQAFSLCHELREIIGNITSDLSPEFSDVTGEERENQADQFAAALLMSRSDFHFSMMDTGLDVVELHHEYSQSYISIIARIATICCNGTTAIPFWGSVVESNDSKIDKSGEVIFRAATFQRSPRYHPKVRYRVPNFFFPRRGQVVPISGLLKESVTRRRPVLVEKVTGLDFWNMYSLTVLIRPVIWGSNVRKLLIVSVPFDRRALLRPQIDAISPLVYEESFQLF